MAAVIGSTGIYNRDPSKITRYHVYISKLSMVVAGSPYESNESDFWTTYLHPARITSAAVANTARTIVSLSDKAGFFTFAMSSASNNVVEFVVTVDGVATTIANMRNSTGEISRACIGAHSGWVASHQSNPHYGYSAGAWTAPVDPFYSSYGFNAMSHDGPNYSYVPDPSYAIAFQPNNVVRFEKSLSVTVKTADAQSSGTNGYAAAHYILDAV